MNSKPEEFPSPSGDDGVVRLCPLTWQHAALVEALHNDPEMIRWTWWLGDGRRIDATTYIAQVESARRRGSAVVSVIVAAQDGEVCGTVSVEIVAQGVGEIGIVLLPGARGRGLASHATALMTNWAFGLGCQRVQALIHPDNHRAINLVRGLGFALDGNLRAYRPTPGRDGDRLVFSALPGQLLGPSPRTHSSQDQRRFDPP